MEFSPKELKDQLREGFVSREGKKMLWDAECYGNVSSLGALHSWLKDLEAALAASNKIEIEGDKFIHSETELYEWIKENFRDAYSCFYQTDELK